jgi:hypothetical protein
MLFILLKNLLHCSESNTCLTTQIWEIRSVAHILPTYPAEQLSFLLWVNAFCCVVTMNKYKNSLFVTK